MQQHGSMSLSGPWPSVPSSESSEASPWAASGGFENRGQHTGSWYPPLSPPTHQFTHGTHGLSTYHSSKYSSYRRPLEARSISNRARPLGWNTPQVNLWPTFMPRKASFYKFGRVFKIAPHEKVGESTRQSDEQFVTQDCYGRRLISKSRICIVVEAHKGFSNVVTINGYSDRSLDKRSTNASEHAAARTIPDHSPPSEKEFSGRAGLMLQEPICITPEEVEGSMCCLRPGSVVDFGRVSAVQHYHEAEPFGFVTDECLEVLQRLYNTIRAKCAASNNDAVQFKLTHGSNSHETSNCSQQATLSTSVHTGSGLPLTSLSLTANEINMKRVHGNQATDVYKYISNSAGTVEERDEAYRQQSKGFFSWGTMFRLLSWTEESADKGSVVTQVVAKESKSGVPILRGVLWLLVIEEGDESCKCLRVLTYEGRGVSELPPGLSIGDHSIIYTGRQIPDPVPKEVPTNPQERQMGLPVRVRRCNRMEKLFPAARLLWTRIYDVKLDVKAKAFGHVSRRCEHVVETQFKQLNPASSIDARRPRSIQLEPKTVRSYPQVDQGVQALEHEPSVTASLICSETEDSDEDSMSSSRSSQLISYPMERQDVQRMYGPGDVVILLSEKDGPSSFPPMKDFVIDTVRLKRDKDGELIWQYNLTYAHGGKFHGGRYFDEGLLMPALRD